MNRYKLLNEVLIEWNESSKEDSDNVFLKSEDIKESLDRCFIYKLNRLNQITIFDVNWPELKKYKDKVWINNQQVELKDNGCTVDYFEPGEYKVYIEDIDKVTDTKSMFSGCEELVSAFIPNSVTSIDKWAFCRCSNLMSVTIPDSITSIGECAFFGCTALTSVNIPNSVASIDYRAFHSCIGLTSITIPNSATSIGYEAFFGCYNLTSVCIPSSVTFISSSAFYNCRNLKTIYIEDINKFNRIKFGDKSADPRYYGAKVIELK